jgi:hypothetical protein
MQSAQQIADSGYKPSGRKIRVPTVVLIIRYLTYSVAGEISTD